MSQEYRDLIANYDIENVENCPVRSMSCIGDITKWVLAIEKKKSFLTYNDKFEAQILRKQSSHLLGKAIRSETRLTLDISKPLFARFISLHTKVVQLLV